MKDPKESAARDERAAFYAEEIIKDAKGQILLHMPYLAEAVLHLHALDSEILTPLKNTAGKTAGTESPADTDAENGMPRRIFRFGTEGRRLFYDPYHVITIFKAEENAFTRDFMHSLLHCLFRHPFPDERTALPGNREV